MDRKQLNLALQAFFDAYRTARYQGVVLSVKSQDDFLLLLSQIEALLLEHDIWRGPGEGGAPGIPCARRDFMDAVLLPRTRAMVILSPRDWMLDWPTADQMTFWSGIADAYGRHGILVLCVATPPIAGQLRVCLEEHALPGLPVSVWLSRHQAVDYLRGVLS